MHFYPRHLLVIAELAVIFACASMLFNVAPHTAHAATTAPSTTVFTKKPFEVSGWIPYWRTATGTADVLPHLSQMTEVNPFGYTVKQDGSLYDAAGFAKGDWATIQAAAKAKKVRFIPTVMWSDTASIHNVLSNPKLRSQHVQAIVDMVNQNGFDGVDIDYEGKLADDRDNYSAFLKELYKKIGNKWVMCTIEARTPPDSLYKAIPADLEYANDYKAINKYCDRVKLMTYDQESADLKLNDASKGLYTPIADPAWVTKVVNLTAKDITKSKIEIGVATYGYIYQVMPYADGSGYRYDLLEAFNPTYATDLAKSLGITPSRNAAGELSFSYVPTTLSKAGLPSQSKLASYAPAGTPSSLLAAVGSLQVAKAESKQSPFYLLWWSDSKAIADKVALAKKLGVRGVAVFKMDGGEDQAMWSVLR
ncbi:MAG: glycosyl hydrolase family 18 protein [Bacillota bacterium]